MAAANLPQFTPTEYITIKEGYIALLNGDNYGIWLVSMKKILLANSCLLICTREEDEPGANALAAVKASYELRKTTALRILNASIPESFYTTISEAAERQDPAGVFNACKEFNRSNNALFYDST